MHWIFLPQILLFLLTSLIGWRRVPRLAPSETRTQQFAAAIALLGALICLIFFVIDA